MNWQEYQDIVGKIYETAKGIGTVRKNITLPDRITGQARQVDAWLEIHTKGHTLKVLIDAKFRKTKVDVKDVEEILALADAVGAHHSILVATKGWTKQAEQKAKASRIDLRVVTVEDAVKIISPGVWKLCPFCERDCIIMDQDGMVVLLNGLILWWLAGQCRECRSGRAWCQDCGDKVFIGVNESHVCYCGHEWRVKKAGTEVRFQGSERFLGIGTQSR